MSRSLRHLIAKLTIALLMFMHLAVAAHACRATHADPEGHAVPAADRHSHHGRSDLGHACDEPGISTDTPGMAASKLCLQHCQQGSQVSDGGAPAATAAVVLPLLAVVAILGALPEHVPFLQRELLTRTTSPPASIRFCVLRS